jgi:hypothetical protein
MSKGVKKVVGVVAAVAIPFVAPAVASSIGLSAAIGSAVGSATAGSLIGSAVTGAALGAAKGAVLGEDIGRSALMGGISGGIGGYTAAPSQAAAGTGISAGTGGVGLTAPTTTSGIGLTAPTTTSGIGLTAPTAGTGLAGAVGGTTAGLGPVDYSLAAGAQFPSVGLNPATAGTGLSSAMAFGPGFFNAGVSNALATGIPIDYSLGAYTPPSTGLQVVSANPVTGGTQVITGSGVYQSSTPIAAYSGGTYSPSLAAALPAETAAAGTTTAAAPAAPTTTKPTTFIEALAQVPKTIADKYSDPVALADLTLRAAGQLAGSAIAGDGLSGEERRLLDAQVEELRRLQQTNQVLFNQRLEQAQNLIGESKYFDPEYFGLQRARRAQIAGARAKRAGLRGLEGAARQAEARRFDLATARDVGTAFDVGYGTGVQGRLSTLQAGINAMPQGYPSSMGDYTYLRGAYDRAAERARQTQRDIGALFGSLTGRNT